MKRILITGASGFIGRHSLPALLENGFEVHALSFNPLADFGKDIIWHNQNFLDDEQTRTLIKDIRPTHCLHLAWVTEPGKYWTSPENLLWAASSLSLLHAFYQNGGERFVGTGTCFEYDGQFGHCSEATTPLEPASLYGTSKNAFQKVLASFSATVGMSSAWGRIFFLYGPHENPTRLMPSVITSLLRNELALCSHGNQMRDYMHVSDVANALVSLLVSNTSGAVNIASGKPALIKDIIYKIAEQLNGKDKLRLGVLPAKNEPSVLTADISRLQNEVGFTPKFDLEHGLKQTIAWWKETLREQN